MKIYLIGCFFLILTFLFGCKDMHNDKKLLKTQVSPDSLHTVSVYYEEPFGFGAHPILVYGKKMNEAEEQLLLQTELYNDGANLRTSNAEIIWIDAQNAQLSLSGKEQDTVHFVLSTYPALRCTVRLDN